MAIKQATTYKANHNDDLKTICIKLNASITNLSDSIISVNKTLGKDIIDIKNTLKDMQDNFKHKQLPDTSEADCHPKEAITGLTMLEDKLNALYDRIETLERR